MNKFYILKNKEPKEATDLLEWGRFMDSNDHVVAVDYFKDVTISTVFIGLDHGWNDSPPILFETMVFRGDYDGEQQRYSTWEEAEIGHKQIVEKVKKIIK